MARTQVVIPDWIPYTFIGDETLYDNWALSIRDAFRTALDGDGLHTNWLVTDLIKWSGVTTTQGYAFVVRHMVATVADGPAWLFVIPGKYTAAANVAQFNQIMEPAEGPNYFIQDSGAAAGGGTDGDIEVHYCETGGTTTEWDGGWDSAGALTGGDLSAPTTNPYTDLVGFMPGTGFLPGLNSPYAHTTGVSKGVCIFDDAKPFMALYRTEGAQRFTQDIHVSGKIVEPYLSSDTKLDGIADWTISLTATSLSTTYEHVHAYNESSVSTRFSLDYPTHFGTQNSPMSSGTYPWEVVTLYGDSFIKGYLDSDIVRVMGQNNREHTKLYSSSTFIKYHRYLCFPWMAGITTFPGG